MIAQASRRQVRRRRTVAEEELQGVFGASMKRTTRNASTNPSRKSSVEDANKAADKQHKAKAYKKHDVKGHSSILKGTLPTQDSSILQDTNTAKSASKAAAVTRTVPIVQPTLALGPKVRQVAKEEATHPPSKSMPAPRLHLGHPSSTPTSAHSVPRGAAPATDKLSSVSHWATRNHRKDPGPLTTGPTVDIRSKKYKSTSRRILAIMVGLPFVVMLSNELYQRQFLGKERTQSSQIAPTVLQRPDPPKEEKSETGP